jgi:hypothetical protein
MIEKEAPIRIYNEVLGAKGSRGKLIRVAEGFYEVVIESQGRFYTALLPIASSVILAAEPELEVVPLEGVER